MSFTLSRTIMKRPNPPYRLLIHVGAFINTVSVIALPWVAKLPLQTLRPVLVAQLLFWAFGQFVSNLPANAIVSRNQPLNQRQLVMVCDPVRLPFGVIGDGTDLWKESQQRLRVY
eukprot:COSAG02_NODE_2978_length_7629_cov_3.880478_2_plen_115_part_00